MRHRKHSFKIGKSGAHRKAMLANMVTSLFRHGRIKTTVVKAKELRRWADKMITCAKIGDLHNRRKAISVMRPNFQSEIEKNIINVLFDEIAPKYKDRNGGYTRIIKLNTRKGDGAELCFIELVEEQIKSKAKETPAAEEAPATPVEEVAEAPAEEAAEAPAEEEKAETPEEVAEAPEKAEEKKEETE